MKCIICGNDVEQIYSITSYLGKHIEHHYYCKDNFEQIVCGNIGLIGKSFSDTYNIYYREQIFQTFDNFKFVNSISKKLKYTNQFKTMIDKYIKYILFK